MNNPNDKSTQDPAQDPAKDPSNSKPQTGYLLAPLPTQVFGAPAMTPTYTMPGAYIPAGPIIFAPTFKRQTVLSMNLDDKGNLKYPLQKGDYVANVAYPGVKFVIKDMIPSRTSQYGGYEVRVEYVEGSDSVMKTWDPYLWDPASDFYPYDLAVQFWPNKYTPKTDNRYPHKCTFCGGPAYIGFSSLDCKNKCNGKKR